MADDMWQTVDNGLVRHTGRGLDAWVRLPARPASTGTRRWSTISRPSTRDRYDLGLNLKGVAPEARLEASGSFNAMVSHRVRLHGIDEIDGPVESWLRDAYQKA